jgi:nucleotide-binding universal stress UspA family protein
VWVGEVFMAGRASRVVVGVSGSLANLSALHAAVDQARRADLPLVAILAWTPVGGEFAYQSCPCPPMLRVWTRAAKDRLELAFQEAFGGFPMDLSVQALAVRADASRALVAVADEEQDLLVVGSGRRRHLTHPRHSVVTRYVLRHAICPVLTVPPPAMIDDLHGARRWLGDDVDVSPLARGFP